MWLPSALPRVRAGWDSVVLMEVFVPAVWMAKECFPRVSLLWEAVNLWLSGGCTLFSGLGTVGTEMLLGQVQLPAVSQPFLLLASGIPLSFPAPQSVACLLLKSV